MHLRCNNGVHFILAVKENLSFSSQESALCLVFVFCLCPMLSIVDAKIMLSIHFVELILERTREVIEYCDCELLKKFLKLFLQQESPVAKEIEIAAVVPDSEVFENKEGCKGQALCILL
jgi:hypothetical protein